MNSSVQHCSDPGLPDQDCKRPVQVTLSSPDGKVPSLGAIEEDGEGVSSATPDSAAEGRTEGKRGRDPDEAAVGRRLRIRAASGHQVLM